MGTEKRARQKQQHQTRREAAEKANRAAENRTRIIGALVIVAMVAVVAGLVVLLSGDDEADVASEDTSDVTTPDSTEPLLQPAVLVGPGAGATVTGPTECPEADGSSERTTSFEEAPPMCIDESKSYTAVFETTSGQFTVELDAAAAPLTVNNFVVLARYHFYDGIPFHRIVPDFVIQAGDPSDTPSGIGGPGYTIAEEPPEDGTYEKYDLAMAKTQEPNSTGSQFFIVTGDPAPLNAQPTYSLFGRVTSGTEVVDALGAAEVVGDGPVEQHTIQRVSITES